MCFKFFFPDLGVESKDNVDVGGKGALFEDEKIVSAMSAKKNQKRVCFASMLNMDKSKDMVKLCLFLLIAKLN